MSRTLVDKVAAALLYEGYILYPYRPSVKNRQRWTFGGLYPESYCRRHPGSESSANQTECLVHGSAASTIAVTIRFLHLISRRVAEIAPPLTAWPHNGEPESHIVDELHVDGKVLHAWQEAEEREVKLAAMELAELCRGRRTTPFTFVARRWLEPVSNAAGQISGVLVREQESLEGHIGIAAAELADDLFRLTVRVQNRTGLAEQPRNRDEASLRSLASTHTILAVKDGEFVSLTDPPREWHAHAAACQNAGTWPVLVGEGGARDTMLSSPIIVSDYPQLAPESPGDLFDASEIDELLTLRILTLTEEEKQAMATVDERARAVLERTATLGAEDLLRLHGTMRRPQPEAQAREKSMITDEGRSTNDE